MRSRLTSILLGLRYTTAVAVAALLIGVPPAFAADPRDLVQRDCAHCHGIDGNAAPPSFPKLAGLQQDYLIKQLEDYRSGRRPSQVMEPIVEMLSGKQIKELAEYFSQQRRKIGTPYIEGMVPLGRRVYHEGDKDRGVPACAGCHKPDGSGTPRSPLLAGQNSAYVLQQLRAFHNDQRTNDRGRLMRTTAERMTEPDMVAVSEYVAGMDVVQSTP